MDTSVIKEKAKDYSLKTVAAVFGTAHFVAQGSAELIREAEVKVTCLIDKGANQSKVHKYRNVMFIKNRTIAQIGYYSVLLKLRNAKDKLDESIDRFKHKVSDAVDQTENTITYYAEFNQKTGHVTAVIIGD